MILTPTPLPGVLLVQGAAHHDARGSFQRTWCKDSFTAAGLSFEPRQASLSTNTRCHTLRGMHLQAAPWQECKLVRCVVGAVWDVALDLRPDSPAFRKWHAVTLDATGGAALFLPHGVAHGFLTLTEGAVVEYLIDAPFVAEAARGVRWDDPAFAIDWPAPPALMSDRDASWPDFGHG